MNKQVFQTTNKATGKLIAEMHLTPGQEAYCRARASGMSVSESIRAAGLKVGTSTGFSWERKEHIRDRIAYLSEAATKNAIISTGLDREWVISRLMSVAERCMQAEPVKVKGEVTGEYQFDSTGANHALKLLGDTLGMFKPVEKKMDDDFANLSDDDLRRIAADLAKQTGLLDLPLDGVTDVTPK